ncbi:MAG: 3-phosphoglycerate dehydrogenase [Clostridia bacterium]|nr:3-phosphoglycerate dehydrogenase [Clostridia bacterium]
MKKILALNNISKIAENKLKADYEFSTEVTNPDAIILRSFSMHEYDLPETVLAVARAGAGTNNIPVADYAKKGVVVFNTPGANANAVKELVIASLLMSGRKIVDAIKWADTLKGKGAEVGKLVESGKKAFVGREITGKTLGVIGLGAIGILVANAALALGMQVVGYDPYLTTEHALRLDSKVDVVETLDELMSASDFVTVHVPFMESTKNTINANNIAKMKKGGAIINLARGGLVDSSAVIDALASGQLSRYVTDFPSDDLIGVPNVVAMPHLGASTPEAEDNCAIMAVAELKDFLENGNIRNSVNFPACYAPRCGASRITVIHKNEKSVISAITDVIGKAGCNIENFVSQSRGDYAYAIVDTTEVLCDDAVKAISEIPAVIKCRVI